MPKENQLRADFRKAQIKSTWQPEQGWLMMNPVELPSKTEAGVLLPESFTKKATSGVCLRMYGNTNEDLQLYLGMEIYFPLNAQYTIQDSETLETFYLLPINQVIMTRTPPPPKQVFQVAEPILKGEREGMSEPSFSVATLQPSDPYKARGFPSSDFGKEF